MRARWVWAALAAVMVLGACGGGSSEEPATAGPDGDETSGAEQALATAVSIDANVDVSLAAAEFTSVNDPVPVEAGDVVRTDSSGFAEVTYFDGSLTRLDVDTSFTVTELTDTPDASIVRTDMGIGRTWNRVEELSGDDQFIVDTAVATATVRGTAFLIDCPNEDVCLFTVVEGTIELTLPDDTTVDVDAPSSVTVTDGEASDPFPAPWDTTFGADDWLLDNGGRDTELGFASPEDIYEAHGGRAPAGAGDDLLGELGFRLYDVTYTVAQADNYPLQTSDGSPVIGDDDSRELAPGDVATGEVYVGCDGEECTWTFRNDDSEPGSVAHSLGYAVSTWQSFISNATSLERSGSRFSARHEQPGTDDACVMSWEVSFELTEESISGTSSNIDDCPFGSSMTVEFEGTAQ